MLVGDTNILVYAADEDSPFHSAYHERQRNRADAWFITWAILYEFLRVTIHPRVMRRPWNVREAWVFVQALLTSPGLSALVPTQAARMLLSGFSRISSPDRNLLHDTHTAILLREHGIRQICTRDTDFHRFHFLEMLDPLGH